MCQTALQEGSWQEDLEILQKGEGNWFIQGQYKNSASQRVLEMQNLMPSRWFVFLPPPVALQKYNWHTVNRTYLKYTIW